jgi:hypothetical protein
LTGKAPYKFESTSLQQRVRRNLRADSAVIAGGPGPAVKPGGVGWHTDAADSNLGPPATTSSVHISARGSRAPSVIVGRAVCRSLKLRHPSQRGVLGGGQSCPRLGSQAAMADFLAAGNCRG